MGSPVRQNSCTPGLNTRSIISYSRLDFKLHIADVALLFLISKVVICRRNMTTRYYLMEKLYVLMETAEVS